MQTFNGLSSAVPRVLKLNKYLSYKYMGTSADSEELFSIQLAHILASLRLFFTVSQANMWSKLSEAFTSLVVQSYTWAD